jgi:hypothetical protein
MKIKIPDLIVYAVITVVAIFFIVFLVAIHGDGNDVRPTPHYPNDTINTNATTSDPILGQWVRLDNNMVETDNMTIGIWGYMTKWENHNGTLLSITGPWTKVSENTYFVRWQTETEWFTNYGVVQEFIPTNESIIYNSSTDSINSSSVFYIRDNATMTNYQNSTK